MPESYAGKSFLGKEGGNDSLQKKVIDTAKKIEQFGLLQPKTSADWIKEQTEKIITGLWGPSGVGPGTVEKLIETTKDTMRVVNKQKAEECLDILGKSIYLVMGLGDDPNLRDSLGLGSASKIDDLMPKELKGIGETVRNHIVFEPTIVKFLDVLDKFRKKCDLTISRDRTTLRKKIEEAYDGVADLDNLSPDGEHQQTMVKAYLNTELGEGVNNDKPQVKTANVEPDGGEAIIDEAEIERVKREGGLSSSEAVEYLKAMVAYQMKSSKYQEEQGKLAEAVKEVSLQEIVDAYVGIKAPRERAPQMWEYHVPEFMGDMSQKDWRDLLSTQDAWLGAIYNKQANSDYNNSIDKMAAGILGMKTLSEDEIKQWYDHKVLNLKGVMHQVARELLTPTTITQVDKITGVSESRTIYAFKTEPGVKVPFRYVAGGYPENFVENSVSYKKALAQRLVDNKVVANLQVAKLSVALAMDFMEMGGVFSEADTLRLLSWESDAVRLAQRPNTKFSSKVSGGELFAGPWTEYANSLTGSDPTKAAELVSSLGVVPELLSGSFLDQSLRLPGEKNFTKQTMMEMIYDDVEIPFREVSSDLYFGWRKDHVMSAARMWMYIANKNPLSFSRNEEADTTISKWRTDLYNDSKQLLKNKDALLPLTVIAGAIGGSVGLWPFNGPYLRVNDASSGDRIVKYFESGVEIIRQLGLIEVQQQYMLDFFGVNKDYADDLNRKLTFYRTFRNFTQSAGDRERARMNMLRPRQKANSIWL